MPANNTSQPLHTERGYFLTYVLYKQVPDSSEGEVHVSTRQNVSSPLKSILKLPLFNGSNSVCVLKTKPFGLSFD